MGKGKIVKKDLNSESRETRKVYTQRIIPRLPQRDVLCSITLRGNVTYSPPPHLVIEDFSRQNFTVTKPGISRTSTFLDLNLSPILRYDTESPDLISPRKWHLGLRCAACAYASLSVCKLLFSHTKNGSVRHNTQISLLYPVSSGERSPEV